MAENEKASIEARWKEKGEGGKVIVVLLLSCGHEMAIHCRNKKSANEAWKEYGIGKTWGWGDCQLCQKKKNREC